MSTDSSGPTPDLDRLMTLLRRHGHPVASLRLLGSGLDHVTYEVDDRLVVRVPRRGRSAGLAREAELLRRLAAVSPLPVPDAAPVDGALVYRKVPGVPLLDVDRSADHAETVGTALGGLLTVLHAQPVDAWADVVEVDATEPAEWLDEAAATYAARADDVPAVHRAAIETFLAEAPPPAATDLVLCHNDLGIEHVLVDPSTLTVTGVIDWSDAAITDPARDLGLLYRDLGPAGARAALDAYDGAADGTEAQGRAVFYARCGALEDLAYGIGTGRQAYSSKSLASFAWLFPASTTPRS